MRPVYIYISLFFIVACTIAPSMLVISDLKVKETKVAKLFDVEEEDDMRDSDSETEKETDSLDKLFKNFFTTVVVTQYVNTTLVHHYFYQCFFSEPFQELQTPPPRNEAYIHSNSFSFIKIT